MRFSRVLLAILIATSLASISTHVNAQTVLARVLDGEDSRPVFGALTYLVDSDGTVLKNALTDQLGRALFVGLEAGAFRVRVEMIGKATVETDLFQVAAGQQLRRMCDLNRARSSLRVCKLKRKAGVVEFGHHREWG